MPLRNSLHRRSHKERSQLAHRSKLGLLEKHKDYVLRARDYRSKRERIRTLRLKAESRNRDEFYFGMNRKKTRGGVEYGAREAEGLGEEMVKVLKSQDEGYLRTVRKKGLKVSRPVGCGVGLTVVVEDRCGQGAVDGHGRFGPCD
jgi:U3 small nucleolar RNA-associated protein 11